MSLTPAAARSCASCSTLLQPGAYACPRCGHAVLPPAGAAAAPAVPPPYGHPGGPVRVVSAKSPGVAAVLSIWLGVGHLYVGENVLGFCLLAVYLFLCLLSFLPILWILTIPALFIAFVFVAMHASKAANDFNRRNGIVVH
jgi:hypothetical protein